MLNENTTENTREMVRYAKTDNGQRKNTLFTFRNGDDVFFGVSRCRLKADKFDKELGLHIARERALKAFNLRNEGTWNLEGELAFFSTPLNKSDKEYTKGKVALKDIKALIAWFKKFN